MSNISKFMRYIAIDFTDNKDRVKYAADRYALYLLGRGYTYSYCEQIKKQILRHFKANRKGGRPKGAIYEF